MKNHLYRKPILAGICLLAVSVSLPMQANGDGKDFVIITQENGKTLGYSPESGVQILTVDGLKFKDLNRNGKLDKYEDWRLPAKERAQAEADRIIASAKAEAAQEMQRAREQLRDEVAALAVAGAEQILAREVDKTVHAQLLEQLKAKL